MNQVWNTLGPWTLPVVVILVILFMNRKHGWKASQLIGGMFLMAALSVPWPGLISAIDTSGLALIHSIH